MNPNGDSSWRDDCELDHSAPRYRAPAKVPTPPAVTEFLSARAAAAASLLVARQTVRRHDVASHVLHEAVGHAGRVCALLLRDGHPAEAMTYAIAAGMLDERATRARAHTMRTLAVLRGAA